MASACVLAEFGTIFSPTIRVWIAKSALPQFLYLHPTQLPACAGRVCGSLRTATSQTAAEWPGKRDNHV